jgi:hypothetical protein
MEQKMEDILSGNAPIAGFNLDTNGRIKSIAEKMFRSRPRTTVADKVLHSCTFSNLFYLSIFAKFPFIVDRGRVFTWTEFCVPLWHSNIWHLDCRFNYRFH